MSGDEYSAHRCNDCDTDLVSENGNWFCPRCHESFELVPDRDEFIV